MKSSSFLYRRRRGATLGLVGVCALVIAVLGFGLFFFMQIIGGGRELANATDSGALNVAKQALKTPSKDLMSFSNPDVATNFAVYGDPGTTVHLLNYNRLVGHAVMVALNARTEGTSQSAQNARKVWNALNEVSAYFRRNLEDPEVMGAAFEEFARANNLKMLGNNGVSLRDYAVSYMKRGGSTNLVIEPSVLEATGSASLVPKNGNYMAGYSPFTVNLAGQQLTFCGVTMCPEDRPHLVSYGEFKDKRSDSFVTQSGYPDDTLPPNSFSATSQSKEQKSKAMATAIAAAIVGCLSKSYPLTMQYGYIMVRNGQSARGPKGPMGLEGNDIFCHKLAQYGVVLTGTGGSDFFEVPGVPNLEDAKGFSFDQNNNGAMDFTETKFMESNMEFAPNGNSNLINFWYTYNTNPTFKKIWDEDNLKKDANGNVELDANGQPISLGFPSTYEWARDVSLGIIGNGIYQIFHADGRPVIEADLKTITKKTNCMCKWHYYDDDPAVQRPECIAMIETFKKAYGQYGETDGSPRITGDGFTALETFKCDVQSSRVGCGGCQSVPAPSEKSGVKWFDHNKKYSAPGRDPYNFGVPKTAYDYLEMIDQAPNADGCGRNAVIDRVTNRCREIIPGIDRSKIIQALKSKALPLGKTLYLYGNGSNLVLEDNPPPWASRDTQADGGSAPCGKSYDVIGKFVNTSSQPPGGPIPFGSDYGWKDPDTDGYYPGWNYRISPKSECKDEAVWIPSSGYNQLLGALDFQNSCSGGGRFCEPN